MGYGHGTKVTENHHKREYSIRNDQLVQSSKCVCSALCKVHYARPVSYTCQFLQFFVLIVLVVLTINIITV